MTSLFNCGWEFSLQPLHTTYSEMDERQEHFAPVGLPHDWLIYDTDNLYQDGTGWYRKTFKWKKQEDERVFLRFDGIYMDSKVYVNGQMASEWKYGYSAFEVELTTFLRDGENEIRVSVDFQAPNSRWYSGAGIYRNVWLKTVHETHLVSDGVYFHAEQADGALWNVEIEAEVAGADAGTEVIFALVKKTEESGAILQASGICADENLCADGTVCANKENQYASEKPCTGKVNPCEIAEPCTGKVNPCEIAEPCTGKVNPCEVAEPCTGKANPCETAEPCTGKMNPCEAEKLCSCKPNLYHTGSKADKESKIQAVKTYRLNMQVSSPECWDVEHPVCYTLQTVLRRKGEILQQESQTVGFRTLEFSPSEGFLLNGRKVKLNGVCEHHDLGCLGSAFHEQAMRRKFRILKEMGVNAVRLTHNMPAAEVMELGDEMGILLVSEAFDMWVSTKTPYDYGRFFADWYQKDVASWVRRDRNHPSLIMWSIGNEIYDTHISEIGQKWTRILMDEVEKHDPKGNARPTLGSNYMPWENAQKCADIIKVAGYNYGEIYYDEHHEKHPDWIIYGSETSSIVQSRGIYHFPYRQSVLADEDEQCSALGNSTTSWGAKSSEACIIAERDRAYSCGQFLWSGFDYIGEPTPYHTRNSYFGQIDTAGFPKDSYYIYQAEWTDVRRHPMVHLFPYWDFNDGQMIDVRAYTNAPAVELFLNGESQGICQIDHAHGEKLSGDWQIPYTAGEIRAVAYDEQGSVIAEDAHHSFGEPAVICMKPESQSLKSNGNDLLFVEVSMEDADGYPVENANNRVNVCVEGAGRLVGTDNGDSTDTDGYKSGSRRLFSGRLLVVAKAGSEPGILKITVSSAGLQDCVLEIPVEPGQTCEGISEDAYLAAVPVCENVSKDGLAAVPECENVSEDGLVAVPGCENVSEDGLVAVPGCENVSEDGLAAVPGCENISTAECENSRLHETELGNGDSMVCVSATKPGHGDSAAHVSATKSGTGDSAACVSETKFNTCIRDIPVRNIYLTSSRGCLLGPGHRETTVTAVLHPTDASDQDVIWSIVDDAGIPSALAEVRTDGQTAYLTAKSDGRFRLRCMSKCGTGKVRIISQLEFTVNGLGAAYLDPYGFIAGGLYDYSRGAIGNGNEHGVATARDGESQVGFHDIDFGSYGSDEITLPIFALTADEYRIRIYEGMPDEDGAELVADVIYQKPSIWNTYQEETYRLKKRLHGVTSLCFVLENKVHIKGFSFTRKNRAFETLKASECDKVYGDSFCSDGDWIREIGNNVTLEFHEMEFGDTGAAAVTICGSTLLEKNTIILRVSGADGEESRILEFKKGAGEQRFAFERLYGTCTVRFVFLPGSSFDFGSLRFEA